MPLRRTEGDSRDPEELNLSELTIAVLKLGDIHYLVQEKSDGAVVLKFINPDERRLDFMNATKKLDDKHFITFEHDVAARIKVVNFALSTPKIKWSSRTQVTEEPTIVLQTHNAIKNKKEEIEIQEDELIDLFLKPNSESGKSASFFITDSLKHELIGIVLNREYPVIIFIQPAKDGGTMVPQQGLISFIKGVYSEYRKKLSDLQKAADDRIFEEFGPSGSLRVEVGSSSGATGSRHKELVKTIYQLKALLIAGEAGKKATGVTDPDLMAHMPFINEAEEDEEDEGFFGRFFGNDDDESSQKNHAIGFEQWNEIVADDTSSLLTSTSGTNNFRPWQDSASSQPVRLRSPRVVTPPEDNRSRRQAPVSQSPSRPVSVRTPRRNRAQEAVNARAVRAAERAKEKEMKEKQAEILIRRIGNDLENTTKMFQQLDAKSIDESLIEEVNARVRSILSKLATYFEQNDKASGRARVTTKVSSNSSIKFSTFDSKAVFAFLTGYKALDYKEKIEAAFNAWDEYVLVASNEASDKFSRTFRGLQRERSSITSKHPELSAKLINSCRRVSNELVTASQDTDAVAFAHMAIVLQIVNALHIHYKNLLSQNSSKAEFGHWLEYSQAILTKVVRLNYKKVS